MEQLIEAVPKAFEERRKFFLTSCGGTYRFCGSSAGAPTV
jgi:hypothetical protein